MGAGSGEAAQVCPQHHKLDSSHMRNPNVSSAILGGVRGTRDGRLTDSLMALATLDGTFSSLRGGGTENGTPSRNRVYTSVYNECSTA